MVTVALTWALSWSGGWQSWLMTERFRIQFLQRRLFFSSEAAILNLFMSAHSVRECMIKIALPLFLEQASIAGQRGIRISHQSSPTFESQ